MSDQVDRLDVLRHWLAYPTDPWRWPTAGPIVIPTKPARRAGWRIEGPFVPEEQLRGAVETLGEIQILLSRALELGEHKARLNVSDALKLVRAALPPTGGQ